MVHVESVNVLVLCTGNICRSPVAEAVLAHKLQGVRGVAVASAGLHAPRGVSPHPLAVLAAAELGYHVEDTRTSTPVGEDALSSSNLILVMDLNHKSEVRRRCAALGNKTFLIGQWGVGEIPDPINQSSDFFRITVRKIESAVCDWVPRITSLLDSQAA